MLLVLAEFGIGRALVVVAVVVVVNILAENVLSRNLAVMSGTHGGTWPGRIPAVKATREPYPCLVVVNAVHKLRGGAEKADAGKGSA